MIKATLVKKHFHTDSIVILHFTFAEQLEYTPGQFMTFELDKEQKVYRSYSIARAHGNSTYEFAVALMSGKGSVILRNMNLGHTLGVLGPFGEFILTPPKGQVVLAATNTGIVPFVAMIEQLRTLKVPVTLLYGVGHTSDILYADLWQELSKDIVFTWKIRVSKGPIAELPYLSGRILDDLCKMSFTPQDDVYLCGHPHMIYDARHWLNNKFSTNIKLERFG
jgi:ferredoxin-NADP reductase